ncbi:FemAB family PEP-CTERM system-associated protein [Sphingomonas sp. H39-1-10]|uniref:FemAB family XrtA/PEP-CTERM system-associated protein n=1 Tax=Sphingomonas pollutisoli TaxID=3030829 RepID=UPI0023B8E292|nr:FemAB family XrtA/PEP-CTERM system-associated protein [Sphingomonas pollutisoli]MDF0489473.1 FemAB family PEP-CTERM system-associated protein [Sphingomonas pollutisoli]
MNAPLLSPLVGLRSADLADAADAARIAAFVRAHPQGTPFHLPAWSLAVARGCGQRSHTLIAERGDGTIEGVLPMTEIRSRLFGHALVSNGFAVGGGILAESEAAAGRLAEAGWALALTLGCPSLELRGGALPEGDWTAEEGAYLGFTRALAASDEAELTAIPRKQRAEVRKALALDLDVTVGRGVEDRRAHYAVYAESVRNLGTPVFPAKLFRSVLEAFGDDADILTVRSGGKPVASVLSLYHAGTVYPYWGGGTVAARALRANDRMYFALMSHARARGCTRFDFGRSKVGTGPAAFKKNWGFEGVPLRYAKRVKPGDIPREINPLSPKYRLQVAVWKKLPLGIANVVGPLVSRGLG